jgi:hypothetical protein
MGAIPASAEVVGQTVHDLTALYQRVQRAGGAPYRAGLSAALSRLADEPVQALQVALALGDGLVTPIRGEMDLTDPEAGIFFQSIGRPRSGEYALAIFMNMLLPERREEAEASFLPVS